MAFPPSRPPSLLWHLLSVLPHSILSSLFSLSPFLSHAPPLPFSIYSSSFLSIITSSSLVFALSFILTSQSSLPLPRSLSHDTWQNHRIFQKKRESVVCHGYWSMQRQDFFFFCGSNSIFSILFLALIPWSSSQNSLMAKECAHVSVCCRVCVWVSSAAGSKTVEEHVWSNQGWYFSVHSHFLS